MEFKPSGKRNTAVDPFAALRLDGTEPVGAGIGTYRFGLGQGAPKHKRRTPATTVFGDTPPRDGPFAISAEPLATQFPPKARVRGRTQPSGPNPFNMSKPK